VYIEGWAFSSNSGFLAKQNRETEQRIEQYKDFIVVENTNVTYARNSYSGYIKEDCPIKISEKELAIYLDSGNLCFGGVCEIRGDGHFTCRVYTD
jgi:hypothetical protein